MYELARPSRRAPGRGEVPPVTAAVLERLTALLIEALHSSGYVNPKVAASTEEKARRLLRRLNLEARDAEVWLGIWRAITWKLRSEKGRR